MKNDVLKAVNDIIIDENCMWIISDVFPCLFKYDFLEKELAVEAVFSEVMESADFSFSRIVKLENEIYIIPRVAEDIYYYDLLEKKFYGLNICFDGFSEDKIIEVVVQGKYVYCINRFPDIVIRIDSATKAVNIFRKNTKPYTDIKIESWVYYTYKNPCICQDKIFWTNYKNMLTIFDTKNEDFSVVELYGLQHGKIGRLRDVFDGDMEDYIIGVRVFEDILWLFSYEGKVYQYDGGIHMAESQLFDDFVHYEDTDDIRWSVLFDIVPLKDELIFIPAYKNHCVRYNGHTEKYEKVLDDYTKNWEGNRRIYTVCKVMKDQKILLYSYYESMFCILDVKNNSVCQWQIEFPWEKFAEEGAILDRIAKKDGVYRFDHLNYLFKDSIVENCTEQSVATDTIGKQIYEALK